MAARVLVVDDERDSRAGLALLLTTLGYEVEEAAEGEEAVRRALVFRPAVIIADLLMPGLDGLGVLKAVRAELPAAAVILLTGHASVETAVTAMKEGAYDYLTKPVEPRRLSLLLEKAVEKAQMAREVIALRRQVRDVRGQGSLLGGSPAMREVYRLIDQAAATPVPVLISGGTGTGKELAARTIHELSARRPHQFVAVNCSAIPETLLESELFGHEKGAFTGALQRREGYFELADGGTLFLDEITEMSPRLQTKYLRVLQDGFVRRLGAKGELRVDVRIIAATNRDPAEAVKDGKLREDLYYRLNVLAIEMPLLRQRRDDIPLLIEEFIREFNEKYGKSIRAVDEASLRLLQQHDWPGNVRELRNMIERAVVQCAGPEITVEMLRFGPTSSSPAAALPEERPDSVVLPLGTKLDQAERELILRTLKANNDNKTRAAEVLGVSPKTLHNKLQRYAAEDAGSPST